MSPKKRASPKGSTRPRAERGGVAEGPRAGVGGEEDVAPAGGGTDDPDDRAVELGGPAELRDARVAVEDGVAEGEDPAGAVNEPVALAGGRRGGVDDRMAELAGPRV